MLSLSSALAAPAVPGRLHLTRSTSLLRSPRSNPMVSFCWEIFLLCFATAVLTFFIAGLLLSLVPLSTSITWERTPHPVRRPVFSSHLRLHHCARATTELALKMHADVSGHLPLRICPR